jgi:hypothetical protein
MNEMVRTWRRAALVIALAVLLLLRGPALIGTAWGNAGMLLLRDALLSEADLVPGSYPLHGVLPGDGVGAQAMQALSRAVALNRGRVTARWELGRAALAIGDAEAAADALRPLAGDVGPHPLLYQDMLVALGHGGRPAEVIVLFESVPPPQPTETTSDTVALAYLDSSHVPAGAGDPSAAESSRREPMSQEEWGQIVERVHALRPGDLYANYHLWKEAQRGGDGGGAGQLPLGRDRPQR